MDNTNMSLNDIATIRNILVGKEMRDRENEFQSFKSEMAETLKSIETAIDQLNQKIESVRQETNEHFQQLNEQVHSDQKTMQHQLNHQNQQQHREIAAAFTHLSNAFSKFSEEISEAADSNSQS